MRLRITSSRARRLVTDSLANPVIRSKDLEVATRRGRVSFTASQVGQQGYGFNELANDPRWGNQSPQIDLQPGTHWGNLPNVPLGGGGLTGGSQPENYSTHFSAPIPASNSQEQIQSTGAINSIQPAGYAANAGPGFQTDPSMTPGQVALGHGWGPSPQIHAAGAIAGDSGGGMVGQGAQTMSRFEAEPIPVQVVPADQQPKTLELDEEIWAFLQDAARRFPNYHDWVDEVTKRDEVSANTELVTAVLASQNLFNSAVNAGSGG